MVSACGSSCLERGAWGALWAATTGVLARGRYPEGDDEEAQRVAADLRRATFLAEPRADIMRWKYRKLLMNLENAVEALCGPVRRENHMVTEARREGVECLRAAGIPFVSDEDDPSQREKTLELRPINGQRRGGGSSWQSLERRTHSI